MQNRNILMSSRRAAHMDFADSILCDLFLIQLVLIKSGIDIGLMEPREEGSIGSISTRVSMKCIKNRQSK